MSERLILPRLGEEPGAPFPPTETALERPNGLLAGGGDLSPQRILNAYRQGIFPWYSDDSPILWWSPAPRCIIVPDQVHLSRRTRRRFNMGQYRLTLNTAFAEVIHACAAPRETEDGTWLTGEMQQAYIDLHGLGHAHSLEVWLGDELAGGIYGLSIGAVFFGESMFSRRTDGSKIALVALCKLLCQAGIPLLDCQVGNPHLFRMGAEEVSRDEFESRLARLVDQADRFAFPRQPPFELRW